MWDVGLASMFKDRDNKGKTGACVGLVVSVDPLKISILNGEITLQGEQLYIARSLLNRTYMCDISGDGNMGNVINSSGTLNSLDLKKDANNGTTKLYFELNLKDEVLLIPTENEQEFFIIDIVERVGG